MGRGGGERERESALSSNACTEERTYEQTGRQTKRR
jgi:hypothetical protein